MRATQARAIAQAYGGWRTQGRPSTRYGRCILLGVAIGYALAMWIGG